MTLKRSSSAAKARLTPPSERASGSSAAPPTDTIEIAVGPNTTGHTDQIASVHAPMPADAATDVGSEEES